MLFLGEIILHGLCGLTFFLVNLTKHSHDNCQPREDRKEKSVKQRHPRGEKRKKKTGWAIVLPPSDANHTLQRRHAVCILAERIVVESLTEAETQIWVKPTLSCLWPHSFCKAALKTTQTLLLSVSQSRLTFEQFSHDHNISLALPVISLGINEPWASIMSSCIHPGPGRP